MRFGRKGSHLLFGTSALAQDDTQSEATQNMLQDIIVTARKRSETSPQVPVTIAAISGQDLQNRAINSVDAVAPPRSVNDHG